MKYENRNFHEPEEITGDIIGNPKIKNKSDIISHLYFKGVSQARLMVIEHKFSIKKKVIV